MLELYAKIEPGSSWIAIFVETVLQNIAEKIKAMTPKQTMSTIAIVAVAATLSLATNKIVDYQTKIKELEIQAKTATDTAKILAQTQIETIKAQTEFYKEIAKQTNAQIEIDDEKIDPDQIKAITNQVRSKATKTHHVLEGDYKVTDIHIADDWVSIDVIGTDGSVIKDINLLETFINQDDYKLIKESANRAFMPMKILLTMKGDKIETATLSEIQ